MNWFRRLFKTYRIIHDPELGYSAERFDVIGWCGIHADGSVGCHTGDTIKFPGIYWVTTEAEAGKRINRHATSRGQKIVWSA